MKIFGRLALALAIASACAPAAADVVTLPQVKNAGGANVAAQGSVSIDSSGVEKGVPTNPSSVMTPASLLPSANFTTPAGTAAYASGNLIANSATAASVTPLSFTACRASAGTGMVRRLRLKTTDTGFAGQTVRIHLHQLAPTFTNGDHGVWLTTESNYLGAIDVTFDKTFSDSVKGIGTPNTGSEINFDCAAGTQVIYGEVEARGAITPQGAKVITAVLEVLAN